MDIIGIHIITWTQNSDPTTIIIYAHASNVKLWPNYNINNGHDNINYCIFNNHPSSPYFFSLFCPYTNIHFELQKDT